MVDFAAIINIITTVITFVQGVVEQVAPIVSSLVARKTTTTTQTPINPNCQTPRCGNSPYYCSDEKLSSVCLQQKLAFDSTARRATQSSNAKDDDDNDDKNKEKSSDSTSPSTTIMLVFVGVIALAIAAFLYMRCNRQNAYAQNFDDRKRSSWDV